MWVQVDSLLRYEGPYGVGRGVVPWARLALITAACGFIYGWFMGSYGLVMGTSGPRVLQALYSALKVPMLLAVTTLIGLPSYFVVNTLLGLRADFGAALRGVLAAQATLAVSLAALAPVTVVFYLSITRYSQAPLFNGVQFAIATIFSQMALGRHYRPLVESNPRHRVGKYTWLAVYIFVAIQMAWVLRPFIGAPGMKTEFFREGAWTNAYVHVIRSIWRELGGS